MHSTIFFFFSYSDRKWTHLVLFSIPYHWVQLFELHCFGLGTSLTEGLFKKFILQKTNEGTEILRNLPKGIQNVGDGNTYMNRSCLNPNVHLSSAKPYFLPCCLPTHHLVAMRKWLRQFWTQNIKFTFPLWKTWKILIEYRQKCYYGNTLELFFKRLELHCLYNKFFVYTRKYIFYYC